MPTLIAPPSDNDDIQRARYELLKTLQNICIQNVYNQTCVILQLENLITTTFEPENLAEEISDDIPFF